MRNLKKVLSLALAMIMVLSMMVTASAAFGDADKIDADYAEAVEVMAYLGILQGDGTNFNPNGTLTRAEAAVILSKAHSGAADVKYFEAETKYTENVFTDVSGWAVPYVLYCYENAIVGGTSTTTYAPSKTLTGYEFAKMLLVAAGFGKHADYVGDATQTWQQKVLAKAKEVDLLAGLEITLSANITREQAAQMALNAMTATSETAYWYVVPVDAELTDAVGKHAEMTDAYIMSAILNAGAGADEFEVVYGKDISATLLYKNFLTYAVEDYDTFGRPATVYTVYDGTIYEENLYFPYAAAAVYTNTTLPSVIAADLKGVKMTGFDDGAAGYYTVGRDTVSDWYITYVEDGAADAIGATAALYTPYDLLCALTGPNTTVEVYTYKNKITDVVVINNYIDKLYNVTEGDLEVYDYPVATVTNPIYPGVDSFITLAGYKKGDVVSYNIDSTGIVNVAPATGFVGVCSSYSYYMEETYYTINGELYVLDGVAAGQDAVVKGTMAKAKEKVYYAGANGSILFVDNMPAETPVVINDFAYVLETKVVQTGDAATGILGGVNSYTAEIQVLLADGKTEIWTLPVYYATKAVAGTTIDQGDYYVVTTAVAAGYINLGSAVAADDIAGLEGAVYTYADKALVAAVPASLPEKSGTIAIRVTGDTVLTGLNRLESAILNDSTVYVVDDEADDLGVYEDYIAVKGLANTANTIKEGSVIIATQTYSKVMIAGVEVETYTVVANTIYAPETVVVEEEVTVTDNMVLISGDYTVSYDAKGKAVYNYMAITVKGEATYVEGATAALPYGIYKLDTEGKLAELVSAQETAYVGGVYGNTVELIDADGNVVDWFIVNANTNAIDLADGLVYGALVTYIDVDHVAQLIFVVG